MREVCVSHYLATADHIIEDVMKRFPLLAMVEKVIQKNR